MASWRLAATHDYKVNISLTISHSQNWFEKQNVQLLEPEDFRLRTNPLIMSKLFHL